MIPAPRSGCASNAAVEVLGGPWAILALRDIMLKATCGVSSASATFTREHLATDVA